jgi:NTP pyrophosphatase (non-canonical NTP hydrolase)
MIDLTDIQQQVGAWGAHNFPKATHTWCVLGLVEEVGELSSIYLKRLEHIRPNQSTLALEIDAIGDIMVFLLHLCYMRGFDIEAVLQDTWGEVQKRDWKKYPKAGS